MATRPTNLQTDGRTDKAGCRVACTRLKKTWRTNCKTNQRARPLLQIYLVSKRERKLWKSWSRVIYLCFSHLWWSFFISFIWLDNDKSVLSSSYSASAGIERKRKGKKEQPDKKEGAIAVWRPFIPAFEPLYISFYLFFKLSLSVCLSVCLSVLTVHYR